MNLEVFQGAPSTRTPNSPPAPPGRFQRPVWTEGFSQTPALFPGSLLWLRGHPLALAPCEAVGPGTNPGSSDWEARCEVGTQPQRQELEHEPRVRKGARAGGEQTRSPLGMLVPKGDWLVPTNPPLIPCKLQLGVHPGRTPGSERRGGHQPRLQGKSTSCTACRSARRGEIPPSS